LQNKHSLTITCNSISNKALFTRANEGSRIITTSSIWMARRSKAFVDIY